MAPNSVERSFSIVVIRPVRRYRWRLSRRNSVSPPSASAMADSVIGNGRSGLTPPTTSPDETCTSWPCSRSVGSTAPCTMTLDSINAVLRASKTSSPTSSRLITHWRKPVESRSTMNQILLEPRVLWTHPFNSTSAPSWAPAQTSPIQYCLLMRSLPVGGSLAYGLRNLDSKVCLDGESDGVRTRDRPVKSRVLYLTKLQTQPTDLTPLYNRDGT